MNNLKISFEKALSDLYTIDWSETDGNDIKHILKAYFDNIPGKKTEIKEMINSCASLNKFQKILTAQILEECC